MKIDKHTIFEIHRLNDLDWSERKIARHLRVSRPSVNKYLINPDLSPAKRAPRPSKLDAYRDLIKQFVEQDPQVKARWSYNGFRTTALTARSPSFEIICKNSEALNHSAGPLFVLNPRRAGKCRSTGVILDTCSIKTPSASCMHWRPWSHIVACFMCNLPTAKIRTVFTNAF